MSGTVVEQRAAPVSPLPDRLELDEGEVLPAHGQAEPTITTEIVFAMNSSFLVPGGYRCAPPPRRCSPASGRFRL